MVGGRSARQRRGGGRRPYIKAAAAGAGAAAAAATEQPRALKGSCSSPCGVSPRLLRSPECHPCPLPFRTTRLYTDPTCSPGPPGAAPGARQGASWVRGSVQLQRKRSRRSGRQRLLCPLSPPEAAQAASAATVQGTAPLDAFKSLRLQASEICLAPGQEDAGKGSAAWDRSAQRWPTILRARAGCRRGGSRAAQVWPRSLNEP